MVYKILLFVSVMFSISAQLMLKFGMSKVGVVKMNSNIFESLKKMSLNPMLWLAIISYGIGFVIYAIVISKMELSRSYPIVLMVSIIVISVVSIIFLNESISVNKIIGLTLCVGGIIFLIF